MRTRQTTRWVASASMALLAGCASPLARGVPAAPEIQGSQTRSGDGAARVVLRVYDAHGNRIDWSSFRQIADNGRSGNGLDDALLSPATMMMIRGAPLFSSNGTGDGDPAVMLPARGGAALSLAWPTRLGYSNLIFDLPKRGGTFDFNALAAKQVLSDIAASLSERTWYRPGRSVAALYATAKRDYSQARYAQSLDAGVSAEMLLLSEAGVAYGAAHPGSGDWGATFDTIEGGLTDLKTAANLFPKNGWLRICFDPGEKPQYYAAEIANAHRLGLHVVGQILDSSEMRRWSVAAFDRRTREYVDALPAVDEWETGNEVNGNWLGSIQSVIAKTRYASEYVKKHTRARVLVTLYWELGDGAPANAIFNWAHANMSSITPYLDDLGISLYPRQNPMGEPFDRILSLLHAAFPQQRIMITELDYDRGNGWWWGSPNSIAPQARDSVAKTYQTSILGYPYSGGGTFWWYFVEEVTRGNPLYRTFKSVYRSAQ